MHAATVNISQPEPLVKDGDLGENWNKWKQNFKIYLIVSGIQETNKSACAHFLHTIGQDGRDIYNELSLSDGDLSLEDLYKSFDKYCNPKSSLAFNRYQFFNAKQGKQKFDAFLLSLKQKSKTCEFGNLTDSLIMTQIIAGISNKKLQERLFLMTDLDMETTIKECRAMDLAELHVHQLPDGVPRKNPPKQAFDGGKKDRTAPKAKGKSTKIEGENNPKNSFQKVDCKFCGDMHVIGSCPAYGTVCTICKKPNHTAKVCKFKKINENR